MVGIYRTVLAVGLCENKKRLGEMSTFWILLYLSICPLCHHEYHHQETDTRIVYDREIREAYGVPVTAECDSCHIAFWVRPDSIWEVHKRWDRNTLPAGVSPYRYDTTFISKARVGK